MSKIKSVAELVREVEEARENLELKQQAASFADKAETGALNRFNAATKALDARLAEIKKAAPRGTDWNQQGRRIVVP